MMRKLLTLIFGILIFSGCSNDNDIVIVLPTPSYGGYVYPGTQNANGEYAVTFSGYSNSTRGSSLTTRAVTNSVSGTGYDDLSVYCWNDLGDEIMNPYLVKWGTYGWSYVIEDQDTCWFSNKASEYHFIGVVPEKSYTSLNNINTTHSLSKGVVTVEGVEAFSTDNDGYEDTPKEFLYCQTTVLKENYSLGATLNFKHGNSKIYLNFMSDKAGTEIIDFKPAIPASSKQEEVWHIQPIIYGNYQFSAGVESYFTDAEIAEFNSKFKFYKDAEGTQEIDVEEAFSKESTGYVQGSAVHPYEIWCQYQGETVQGDVFAQILVDKGITIEQNHVPYNYAKTDDNFHVVHIWKKNGSLYYIIAFSGPSNKTGYLYKEIRNVETPATPGIEGVRVLPATSVKEDGTDAIWSSYNTKETVTITPSTINYISTETEQSISFTAPGEIFSANTVYQCPTVWYMLPVTTQGIGLTVKFSFIYGGTTIYDARAYIPSEYCQWAEGKIYRYTINISGLGNGSPDPDDIDPDDPVVKKKAYGITLNININKDDYTEEVNKTINLEN